MSRVEKIIEEMELLMKELKTELENVASKNVASTVAVSKNETSSSEVEIKENEELMFGISCLDDNKKFEKDDKIYYIKKFIEDPDYEFGDDIYVINKDGTNDHRLATDEEIKKTGRGDLGARIIYDVDDKWVYYSNFCGGGEERRITVRGTMDQKYSSVYGR